MMKPLLISHNLLKMILVKIRNNSSQAAEKPKKHFEDYLDISCKTTGEWFD